MPGVYPNPTRKTVYDYYCNCPQDHDTGSYLVDTLSTVTMPSASELAGDTVPVAANNRVDDPAMLARSAANPILLPGGTSPFKHVILVVKENRTYDQVFGDIQGANGDPSLMLFGNSVTPNQHALARRFGLPDNFYADAEVSATGHNWIDGAYASDYNEKMWPIYYSSSLSPAAGGAARNRAFGFWGGSLVNGNPGGYLWAAAAAAGITYRDQASSGMNFKQEDRAPSGALNRIIWAGVKGAQSTYPVSHLSVLSGDKD